MGFLKASWSKGRRNTGVKRLKEVLLVTMCFKDTAAKPGAKPRTLKPQIGKPAAL